MKLRRPPALFPGVVLLRWWSGVDNPWLPAMLGPLAFTGPDLTLLAALTRDWTAAHQVTSK